MFFKRKNKNEKRKSFFDVLVPEHKDVRKKISPKMAGDKCGLQISPENYFNLHQGGELKDLCDLEEAFSYISDEQFTHHVNGDRNDFSSWVKDVFKEEGLARDIYNSSGKDEMRFCILKFLSE